MGCLKHNSTPIFIAYLLIKFYLSPIQTRNA